MNQEQLQAIRERVNKATLGPWRTNVEFRIAGVNDGSNPYWKPTNIADGKCYWCESYELIGTTTRNGANFHVHGDIPDNQTVVSPSALETVIPDCGMKEEDAEFIAHAREDLPALLDEIERLRDALEFYANDPKGTKYEEYFVPGIEEFSGPDILSDRGKIARQALAGEST